MSGGENSTKQSLPVTGVRLTYILFMKGAGPSNAAFFPASSARRIYFFFWTRSDFFWIKYDTNLLIYQNSRIPYHL